MWVHRRCRSGGGGGGGCRPGRGRGRGRDRGLVRGSRHGGNPPDHDREETCPVRSRWSTRVHSWCFAFAFLAVKRRNRRNLSSGVALVMQRA